MRKYYCFAEGRPVPKWLMGVDFRGNKSEHLVDFAKRNGEVVFGRSCVVLRSYTRGVNSLVMPVTKATFARPAIQIRYFGAADVTLGGIGTATGVYLNLTEGVNVYDCYMEYHANCLKYPGENA